MIKRNIIANIANRTWGVISVYLFVPLYLRYIGIEAYGLIGFYSTLLGVVAFADMGFTATLNRELARLNVRNDSAEEMGDLLRTYESIYLCIVTILALAIWAAAPAIAMHWLRSKVLQPAAMTAAIRLMGIAIAFQLPSGLYIGGLMGLQRQVRANCIQISWGVFRGLGAVVVLSQAPTIFAFALWQLISNAIYCVSARFCLWRCLSSGLVLQRFHIKWQVLRGTWRYALGMTGMALLSTLLTQTDKLAVSKMLSLEMLGYYSLAGALASVPMMLAGPIASAVFPRLTGLVALDDRQGLTRLYHRTCELVGVAVIPAALTVALFARECLFGWTGSTTTAERAGLAAAFLIGGQALQALTLVPYYLALAHGNIRLNLQVGVASAVLVTPLLIFLIMKQGIVGAGLSWLLMNFCALPPYMYYLHRRFLPGEFKVWAVFGVGRSLLVAAACLSLIRLVLPHSSSRLVTICLLGQVWILATAATAHASSRLRRQFWRKTITLTNVFPLGIAATIATYVRRRVLKDNVLCIRSFLVTPYKFTRQFGLLFTISSSLRALRGRYQTAQIRRLYFANQRKRQAPQDHDHVLLREDVVSFGKQEISTLLTKYTGLYAEREDLRILINLPAEGSAQYFYFLDLEQCLRHTGISVYTCSLGEEELETTLAAFRPTIFLTGDSPYGFGLSESQCLSLRRYKDRSGLARLYVPYYASPLRVRPATSEILRRVVRHRNGELADAFIGYFENAFWEVFCKPWQDTRLGYYSIPFAANPYRHYPLSGNSTEFDWGIATANGDFGERAALTIRYMSRIIEQYRGVIAGYNWGKGVAPVPRDQVSTFFSRVRISPNLAAESNVRFPLDCGAKVHELCAMGVFQLTSETEALRKYYSSTEVVGVRTVKEFNSLFDYFVAKPEVRQMFIKNAMARTLGDNTYFHRIDKLVRVLDEHPELFGTVRHHRPGTTVPARLAQSVRV